jgi:hypothetical protein
MKARSAAIQGGLAVAGLVAAFVTWQRPQEAPKTDAVIVVNATKSTLERVYFEDGTRSMAVERKGERLHLTQAWLPGKRPEVDAGFELVSMDGGVDGGAALVSVKAPEPQPDRTVYANDRGDQLWKDFAPFQATRALGKLPPEKLDELGLVGSERKLELRVAGATHRFTISKPVSGVVGTYAQDEKGNVFLLAPSLFNVLDPASGTLIDRRLHAFKQSEYDAFSVMVGDQRVDFVQSGGDVPQTTKVAR